MAVAQLAAILLVALTSALVVNRVAPSGESGGRNLALDGLRGYVALGVFIYHSAIWYAYLRTGTWTAPKDRIYELLGRKCVDVFFMTTAYLFIGKVLDAKCNPINWLALYVSRCFRLTPLYLLALSVLFVLVGVLSGWQSRTPVRPLLTGAMHWLAFSIFATPDLNGIKPTIVLIAGVTWSLGYEWLFYISLPLIAFALRRKVPAIWVIGCGLLLALILYRKSEPEFPIAFVVGAIAAAAARRPALAAHACRPIFSVLVVLAAGVVVLGQKLLPNSIVSAALWVGFCVVACGNSAFGLLTNRPAMRLGEVSYGIYLLHGLLLSITFLLIIGTERAKTFGAVEHWTVIGVVCVALVVVSTLTFRFLEAPAMRSARAATTKLASGLAKITRSTLPSSQ